MRRSNGVIRNGYEHVGMHIAYACAASRDAIMQCKFNLLGQPQSHSVALKISKLTKVMPIFLEKLK
jgi:hypothetical protein